MVKRFLCVLLFGLLLASVDGLAQPAFHGYIEARTRHFIFIYEPADQSAVDGLVSIAEDVYDRVSKFVGSAPPLVRCLVVGRTDEANGYFTPLPPFHLALNVASPTTASLGSNNRSWLRLLLAHELTHFIQFDYQRGLFDDLSRFFGPAASVLTSPFLPGWATEGLAVSSETRNTTGGRGGNPYFHLVARGLVLDNAMLNYGKISYDSLRSPYGRVYLGGYLLWDYLIRTYGTNVVHRIQNDFADFPLFGVLPSVLRATGFGAAENYGAMAAELRREYAFARNLPSGRQVSPAVVGDYGLPVPTDLGWYSYRSRPDLPTAIVRLPRFSGDTEKVVLPVSLSDKYSFTSDSSGRTIVFASYVEDDNAVGGPAVVSDLYVHDVLQDRTSRLTKGADLYQPAISPDGTMLVALQRSGSYRRLVQVNMKTGDVSPFYSPEQVRLFNPIFSPDGDLLAVVENQEGDQHIDILHVAGAGASLSGSAIEKLPVPASREGNIASGPTAAPYFPHFVNDRYLVFSAEWKGTLSLFGTDLRSRQTGVLVTDRVGIARGEVVNGADTGDATGAGTVSSLANARIIYETYSGNGYVVRSRPLPPLSSVVPVPEATAPPMVGPEAASAAAEAAGSASPAAAETETASAVGSSAGPPPPAPAVSPGAGQSVADPPGTAPPARYFDPPITTWWTPLPLVTNDAAGTTALGIAALTGGTSIAGTWNWAAMAGGYPTLLQPTAALSISYARGPFQAGYDFSQSYGSLASVPGAIGEQTSQSVSITVSPFSTVDFRRSRAAWISAGFGNVISLYRPPAVTGVSDFTFTDGFDPSARSFDMGFPVSFSLQYAQVGTAAPMDLYAPRSFAASLSGSSALPIFGAGYSGVHGEVSIQGSVPGFAPLRALRLEISGSLDTNVIPGFRSVAPSGFSRIVQTEPIVAGLDLRYGFTIGRLDMPLPFGLGLTAVGGAFIANYAVQVDPGLSALPSSSGTAAIYPDNRVTLGAEATLLVGDYTVQVPVRIGAAVRFDPTFANPLRYPGDFGFYISIQGLGFLSPVARVLSRGFGDSHTGSSLSDQFLRRRTGIGTLTDRY